MPGNSRQHVDHADNQHKKATAKANSVQAAPVQPMVDHLLWSGSLERQAGSLSSSLLLDAQRSALAAQIARVQGNRQLGQVISSAGLSSRTNNSADIAQRPSEPGSSHPMIQYGSTGLDVAEAQVKLNIAGAEPPLEVDGIFGPLTHAVVVAFQEQNDLAEDGIVGPITWGALDQIAGPEEPAPEETGAEETGPEEGAPELPAPEETGAEEPAPEMPGPEEGTPEEPVPIEPGPEAPAPETSTPAEPTPAEPVPETPAPTEVGAETTGPEEPPVEAAPERWTPEDDARLASQTSDTGPLNAYQASRASLRVLALPETEYSNLRTLLDAAASDMEWAFLLKAAAAQRSITDIIAFSNRISGMSERWLMRNLMVVDLVNDLSPDANPEERGITQQYGNSCGPTSVQLIHAQADPIYALELRSAGPIEATTDTAVSNPETITNTVLAGEQAGILNAHVAAGTGNAPTNIPEGGGGAWVESDMNTLANATGVTYVTKIIGTDITLDAAMTALQEGLANGVHVPIIVGGGTGSSHTSHYVVVMRASGDNYLVHDVATGESVWKTEAQFRGNTLHLPSGWNFFVAIDVPTMVPPPLPAPPTPAGG
jgi:peptidoglycan hydrolase-like protein with peptidoglycan-binding domain